jgi:proteasome lid subunit RPN8/RPN11
MSDEIQFGELEEAVPDRKLRPDQNKQFSVVAIGEPSAHDLPIFVDLDVALDMERHALSDTSVELGGVMLGGQYEDDEGRPFVLVSDALRAEHYESTKGSFTFTHETWEAITRQRDEFPDELQMVGWYHTHPDWGVFLSGMDMFMCDNFFNRPLDIALVINPCRDDRGMFQWVLTTDGQQIRQTDGFLIFSSRLRELELIQFCQHLQGDNMSHDPRYGSSGTMSSAPVVHIHDQRSHSAMGAIAGVLMLQFMLLMLIAWRVFAPGAVEEDDVTKLTAAIEKLEELESAESTRRDAERQDWEANVKLQAIDLALTRADKINPGELTRTAQSSIDAATQEELLRTASAHSKTLNRELSRSRSDAEELSKEAATAQKDLGKSNKKVKELEKDNTELAKEFKEWKADKATSAFKAMMSDYRWLTGLILTVVVLIASTVYATLSIRGYPENGMMNDGLADNLADNGASLDRPPVHDSQWENSPEDSR